MLGLAPLTADAPAQRRPRLCSAGEPRHGERARAAVLRRVCARAWRIGLPGRSCGTALRAGREILRHLRHRRCGRGAPRRRHRQRPRGPGRARLPPPSAASCRSSSPTWSGFTPFAEERDAEDVRATLDRYFAMASEVIGRYGGTVEKFIGDAVMAVWGTPTAHEDDAERSVRAALELVDAVRGLGDGDPGTRRRPDRRGRGHDRRHEPGPRRGRPGQHGQPPPVGRRARHRARGRGDPARGRQGHRLRAGR